MRTIFGSNRWKAGMTVNTILVVLLAFLQILSPGRGVLIRARARSLPRGTAEEMEGATCYNANKVLQSQLRANNGQVFEPWGEQLFCNTLVKGAHVAENEKDFRFKCESMFGVACRHQCQQIAVLFDCWDYTVVPPSAKFGGLGQTLTYEKCIGCLSRGCASPGIRQNWQRPCVDEAGNHPIPENPDDGDEAPPPYNKDF